MEKLNFFLSILLASVALEQRQSAVAFLLPAGTIIGLENRYRGGCAFALRARPNKFRVQRPSTASEAERALAAVAQDRDNAAASGQGEAAAESLLPRGQVLAPSSPSDATTFDTACVANPVVLPPSSPDERWQMYYYGNAGSWNGGLQSFLPTGWVGLAESDDGLTNWTKVVGLLDGGAVLAPSDGDGAWDGVHVGVGDVVRLGPGELHMYYLGGSDEAVGGEGPMASVRGLRMRIGRARSIDGGRTWEKMGVVLDADEGEGLFASWPRIVVPEEGPGAGPWRMLYHAFDGSRWRVFGAHSDDRGETWTRTGPPLLEGGDDDDAFDWSGIGTRAVTRWRDGMLMIYEGVDKNSTHHLGAAYCPDRDGGADWTKLQDITGTKLQAGGPILEPGVAPLEAWTKLVVGTPYLVSMVDGSIRLFHCARSSRDAKMCIGLLISDEGEIEPNSWALD